MLRRLLIALLVAGSLLTACSGDEVEAPKRDSSAAAAAQRPAADGLISLRELRKQKGGSPARAILTLWYWAQWGSAPNTANAYSPRVRTAVGAENLVGSYTQQRDLIMRSRPKILETVQTAAGTFVAVELEQKGEPPRPESYLLARGAGGRWQILHDTFLEQALGSYVQSTVQAGINPSAKKPSARAVDASQAAVRRFRGLFVAGAGG